MLELRWCRVWVVSTSGKSDISYKVLQPLYDPASLPDQTLQSDRVSNDIIRHRINSQLPYREVASAYRGIRTRDKNTHFTNKLGWENMTIGSRVPAVYKSRHGLRA